jgi:hypothetical protein
MMQRVGQEIFCWGVVLEPAADLERSKDPIEAELC